MLVFVGLAEALELTLLLADKEPEKYDRAAARWHVRFLQELPNVTCARPKPCSPCWRQSLATGNPWQPARRIGSGGAPESPALVRTCL